ncbi:MAG: hypothetical protein ACREVV_14310 [Steroidobacteraceae bacterium]
MRNPPRLRHFALGLLIAANWTALACADERDGSRTVLGTSNTLLADGASALQAGRAEEGVRLTLEGLKVADNLSDSAAGHSNACAGYALLKQWDAALVQCNAALDLDRSNWRIYNNRAAIYVAKGLYELAMSDLNAGLRLAPRSATLLESVRIAEKNRRLTSRRGRKAVAS